MQKLSPINPRNERIVFYYKVNNCHSIQIKEENYMMISLDTKKIFMRLTFIPDEHY